MSTLKSSAEDLTLNADGSGNDIILQSNGSNVGTLTAEGVLTATSFAGSGASLTGINTPAFSAKPSGTQDVPNTTYTKVTLGTENFDTDGKFASSTFTPTVAGRYLITAHAQYGDSVTECKVSVRIYKNGSSIAMGHGWYQSSTGSGTAIVSIIDVSDADDYYEMYTWHNKGENLLITTYSSFAACKLGD